MQSRARLVIETHDRIVSHLTTHNVDAQYHDDQRATNLRPRTSHHVAQFQVDRLADLAVNNKKAQLTQRERATAVHVLRPTANNCKIRKNLYFSAQGHSRSLLSVSIETHV